MKHKDGAGTDASPTVASGSYDEPMETFTSRTLDRIETIRRTEPASINETARIVERAVKNVHEELGRPALLGIVYFEEEALRKRPVVWFDELQITLPFDSDAGDPAPVPS